MENNTLSLYENLEDTIETILTPSADVGLADQKEMLVRVFTTIMNTVNRLETQTFQDANDSNNLVLDLEHIIAVGTDCVNMDKLPEELRGLSQGEYSAKLEEVLKLRRTQKDLNAIYKVIGQKCSTIVNFITGMNKRRYTIRYKNADPQPMTQDGFIVDQNLAPVARVEDVSGVFANSVSVKDNTIDGATGYASNKNYPH